jgi:protein-tyrosine phosphatase
VIDLHCHVLAGIDDGPEIIEESVVMARAAQAAGTTILVATPHVSRAYPNDAELIAERVLELRERLGSEGVGIDLRAGAEVSLASALKMSPQELRRYALGGGRWLLVEPPFNPSARDLDTQFLGLGRQGLSLLLAHPERCPAFQRNPQMLRALVERGALASLTADSLVGRFGDAVRRFALTLLREGLAHNVASDSHDRYARAPGALDQIERCGAGALAEWLTSEVPAAILDGGEIPPRPEVALPEPRRPRRWRWPLGRHARTA